MKFILTTSMLIASALAVDFGWSPPSAAITWPSGLGHIRVYAVSPFGAVSEWQYDGAGWSGPSDLGAKARVGTTVSVVNSDTHIRLYYQTPNGGFAEHMYEPDGRGWRAGQFVA